MRRIRAAVRVAALLIACVPVPLTAQDAPPVINLTAPEMWNAWCARCHAPDGSGRMADRPIAIDPLDFTDCRVATAEPDADWSLAIRDGGPAVGLSPAMPAFGDALTATQIDALVAHLRAFCGEAGWPHGNLNFPRPIFTEKAFPENEFVVLPMASHEPSTDVWRARAIYERRIGRRTQFELSLPVRALRGDNAATGFGDIAIAAKHVIASSPARGAIVSGGLELVVPTARASRGLGAGTTVWEPFLSAGLVRGPAYLQTQLKLELARQLRPAIVYNTYAGRDLSESPDTWTIGIELNGEGRELDLTPQIRKGLTRTGALAGAFGARLPITRRQERGVQWVGYLLWEYLEPVRAAR